MLKIIHMTVNGKETELAVDERESLLDTLRNRLGLTSVKKGCEVGECGACTVLYISHHVGRRKECNDRRRIEGTKRGIVSDPKGVH